MRTQTSQAKSGPVLSTDPHFTNVPSIPLGHLLFTLKCELGSSSVFRPRNQEYRAVLLLFYGCEETPQLRQRLANKVLNWGLLYSFPGSVQYLRGRELMQVGTALEK